MSTMTDSGHKTKMTDHASGVLDGAETAQDLNLPFQDGFKKEMAQFMKQGDDKSDNMFPFDKKPLTMENIARAYWEKLQVKRREVKSLTKLFKKSQ